MRRLFGVFLVLFPTLAGCSPVDPCSNPWNHSCTRVLFIGDSYTFVNDLPRMFAELAVAGGHREVVAYSAQGGWHLDMHLRSKDTIDLLHSTRWDDVILQEQSEIPAVQEFRTEKMYPAARRFVREIRNEGATPLFFETWGHRAGWPGYGMYNYERMQHEIDSGYEQIADELHVEIVPVGPAWRSVIKQYPELSLWQQDETHPSQAGTYLTACVFYAVIFHESPVGLSYRADLSPGLAARLQTVAAETVFGAPEYLAHEK